MRLLRPRRPDIALLASLESVPPPAVRQTVTLTVLPQARLSAPETIVAEGVRSLRSLPMVMGAYLVRHPQATFLADPGLCAAPHERVLPDIPWPVRALVTPERPVRGLPELLSDNGTQAEDIDFALPTHLHWDHVSGMVDLPESVAIRVNRSEWEWVTGKDEIPIGVVPAPLRGRAVECFTMEGPPVLTFERSLDLFGDGAVIVVDMAGHTPGSIGILLALPGGRRVLLAGDAVWNNRQVTLLRERAPMPGNLFDFDREQTFATIHRMHALPPNIELVAAHDYTAVTRLAASL